MAIRQVPIFVCDSCKREGKKIKLIPIDDKMAAFFVGVLSLEVPKEVCPDCLKRIQRVKDQHEKLEGNFHDAEDLLLSDFKDRYENGFAPVKRGPRKPKAETTAPAPQGGKAKKVKPKSETE